MPLAIARSSGIQPVALEAEEVVEPADRAARVLQKTQIASHPRQHSFIRVLAPESRTEAQRSGVTLLIFDARQAGKVDTWLRSGGVYGAIGLIYANRSLAIFRVDRPT